MMNLIPRFEVAYTSRAFVNGCLASLTLSTPAASGLEAVFGRREMVWTGSGRQALSLMLRGLNLGAGAKVAIPLLSSGAVAAAVRTAGCEPVFVDVHPRTLTMEPNALLRVRFKVDAIVPVHLFGNVVHMDDIMEAAAGLPVIEDTAQSPLSFWGKRRTGMFGLGSFYSFASSNCAPAGGGGLAAINDRDLANRVRDLAAQLNSRGRLDSLRRATVQLSKAALFSRALYGPIGNRLATANEDSDFLSATVDTRGIAASSAAAVRALAAALPRRLFRQRQNSLQLLKRLKHAESLVLPLEPAKAVYAYTSFPVLLENEAERDAIRKGMLDQGVDTSIVHHNCAEAAAHHGYRGGCPISENVARRLLTLPNFAGLDAQDIDRVASAFLNALERHRTTSRARRSREAYA